MRVSAEAVIHTRLWTVNITVTCIAAGPGREIASLLAIRTIFFTIADTSPTLFWTISVILTFLPAGPELLVTLLSDRTRGNIIISRTML